MKPDLYTKAVLTIMALAFTVIACNQYVQPKTIVEAQSSALGGVVITGEQGGYSFFDTRTGDTWEYGWGKNGGERYEWAYLGKILKLGQPLVGGEIDANGHRKGVTLK